MHFVLVKRAGDYSDLPPVTSFRWPVRMRGSVEAMLLRTRKSGSGSGDTSRVANPFSQFSFRKFFFRSSLSAIFISAVPFPQVVSFSASPFPRIPFPQFPFHGSLSASVFSAVSIPQIKIMGDGATP